MAESIQLALAALSHFEHGSFSIHPQLDDGVRLPKITSAGVTSVRGVLNLSYDTTETEVSADCTFFIPSKWRTAPPHLRCKNRWLRTPEATGSESWHVNSDGTLCYVIRPQWADQIAFMEERAGTSTAIAAAAFYAINNTRWLLYHHVIGYRRKLKEWPGWPEWPHFQSGLEEYERFRRRGIKYHTAHR